jgi:hypothetical protein
MAKTPVHAHKNYISYLSFTKKNWKTGLENVNTLTNKISFAKAVKVL